MRFGSTGSCRITSLLRENQDTLAGGFGAQGGSAILPPQASPSTPSPIGPAAGSLLRSTRDGGHSTSLPGPVLDRLPGPAAEPRDVGLPDRHSYPDSDRARHSGWCDLLVEHGA